MNVLTCVGIVLLLTGCAAQGESAVAESPDTPTIAFTVAERDLLPENIAYDPVDSSFYMGSTRKGKIVHIRTDGSAVDFIAPRQDGVWMIIGMKVDPVRRVLWVCSSAGDNLEPGSVASDGKSAGVFQFDLATGRLIAKSVLPGESGRHFFNDLVLSSAGDAYVTHMFDEPAIYRVRAGSDQLERLIVLPSESYPNGITFDGRGRLLVASSAGIVSVDTGSLRLDTLAAGTGVNTRGIDGMYAQGNQIVAVRPAANEVRLYELHASEDSVVSSRILIANHPSFSNPTTGVRVGDEFYLVANSHFQHVGPGGAIPDSLTAPVVLRVRVRE